MSASDQLELRTCAFGDLDAGFWGIALVALDGQPGAAHLGRAREAQPKQIDAPRIEGTQPDQPWTLRAEGVDLSLSPTGEAATLTLPDHGVVGVAQPCRVQGRFVLDGAEQELDCLGQRGTRSARGDAQRFDSIREVAAWFGSDKGLALLALRPPRATGHDRDALSGVLFEGGHPVAVAEPRLSSTYSAAGLTLRASVELWLEEIDEHDGDGDRDGVGDGDGDGDRDGDGDGFQAAPRDFPRRAAGEAVGAAAQLSVGALNVRAELFRWHMLDREGAGVYLLARPA